MIRSRTLVIAALVAAATAQSFVPSSVASDRKPNVILIVTDDQSPFAGKAPVDFEEPLAWGCYGGRVLTPHVDKLASEGMLFTDANVPSSVCSPSRYAMLTGRHPGRSTGRFYVDRNPPGVLARVENNVDLEPDRNNLPKTLRAAGYRTGFVGKAHVVNHELFADNGRWEEFGLQTYAKAANAKEASTAAKLDHNHSKWVEWVKEHGFDFVDAVYPANLRELFNDSVNAHNVEWTVEAAQRFVEQSKDSPFFLYFATTVPHGPDPWIERNGLLVYSLDADPKISPKGPFSGKADGMPSRPEILRSVKNAGLPRNSAYLTWIDAGIGALMKTLDRLGIADNTIIVVLSDHGAWRFGKTTLYEGGVRVPMIVRWPAKITPGSRFDGLASSLDLAPTILEAAGLTAPADLALDGKSLIPAFERGNDAAVHDAIFGEVGYFRSIKTKRWKYIALRFPKDVREQMERGEKFPEWRGPPRDVPYSTYNSHLGHWASTSNPNYFHLDQLYDLQNDPREEHNLAWEQPNVMFSLQTRLGEFLRTFPERPFGELTY